MEWEDLGRIGGATKLDCGRIRQCEKSKFNRSGHRDFDVFVGFKGTR